MGRFLDPKAYFSKYPTVDYTFDLKSFYTVQNFLKHFSFRKAIKNNRAVYSNWIIRDEDTIFTIAHRLYGSTQYYWVVAMFNDMLNPDWDWPMTDVQLMNYIDEVYGVENRYSIHHWEATGTSDNEGNLYDLPEGTVVDGTYDPDYEDNWDTRYQVYCISHWPYMDGDTEEHKKDQAALTPLGIKSVDNYTFEYKKNEERRNIKLIRPEIFIRIINERDSIIKNNFRAITRG